MTKVAVVILNWNGKEFLEKFLPFVLKYSSIDGVQIYVADNASTDDSVAFINKCFPEVKTIILDRNYGFAQGYNKALEKISAQYFVLLNSDVEVTENWISPIIQLMDNDESIAVYMPKIKDYHKKDHFEHAGAAGGFIDKYGYTFCRGRIFNVIEKDTGQYDTHKEIFWAAGACMFIKSDLYKKAGGLDADFFAHMEEIDLCWQLKNMGFKILFSPDVTVYHIGGGTLSKDSPDKLFLNFRNNLLLLYKNLPAPKLFSTMFIRFILDIIAGIKFLLTFEFQYFISVVKAHFSFLSLLNKFRSKRKNNLKIFQKYDHNEIYNRSIVFGFFIKRIKTFRQLDFFVQSGRQ